MNEFISTVLHMSLTGSIVILIVLAARFLMRKLPKKYLYLLWGIVGLRLLCPFALESDLSVFNIAPLKESVNTVKDLPLRSVDSAKIAVTSVSAAGKTASAAAPALPFDLMQVAIFLWAAVALGIVIYITCQYFHLRENLKNVTELEPGLCVGSQIDSPFVMGLLKPVIYMPDGLADEEMRYLLLHEKTHIRRRDTIFKAIGLVAVALHWFNPLVWLAYKFFVQDMEMSCDEEVISELGANVKADYSMSLVSFASRNHQPKYIVVPVTFSKTVFGRKEVKMRIQNILSYKGTSKLIATVSMVLVAAIGLVCLFNANTHADAPADGQQATAATTTISEDDQALAAAAAAAAADVQAASSDDDADAVVDDDADVNSDADADVPANDADADADADSYEPYGGSIRDFLAKAPTDVDQGIAQPIYGADAATDADADADADAIPAEDQTGADGKVDDSAVVDNGVIMVKTEGFGVELPIVNSENIFNKVDLAKGKHTTKNAPELEYSMGPDDSFNGAVFEIRADKKADDKLFAEQVKILEDMGFKTFIDEGSFCFYGFNKDLKIGVVVENTSGIYRTSYFTMKSADEFNPFLCLG